MALRVAIDANRYADFLRGVHDAVAPLRRAHEIHVPFIVLAELRAGFQWGEYEKENEARLREFLSARRVHVLFADEGTTPFYADVYADLRRRGTPIPTNDIWIAAIALQHDLALLTRDAHFDAVVRLPKL